GIAREHRAKMRRDEARALYVQPVKCGIDAELHLGGVEGDRIPETADHPSRRDNGPLEGAERAVTLERRRGLARDRAADQPQPVTLIRLVREAHRVEPAQLQAQIRSATALRTVAS